MTDKFISGLPTGTIDALSASVALELGMPTGTLTIQSSIAQISQFMAQYGYLTGTYQSMNGFISENGAHLTYITGSSYRVEAGAGYVNGALLTWASPITRTGLTFVSGTMNYVYLYSNAGTPAAEESTTVPQWDTTLQYYKKTGDSSRRCIGFLQAQNANSIRPFLNFAKGREATFLYVDGLPAGARVPVNQNAVNATGTWASVDLSSIVPSHSYDVLVEGKLILSAATDEGILGLSSYGGFGSAAANAGTQQYRGRTNNAGSNLFFGAAWLEVLDTQTIYYRITTNSGNPRVQLEVQGARLIR
jgi:hypothetical protein